jgi:3'(2'), 5'-bisphosphate nucleotidase
VIDTFEKLALDAGKAILEVYHAGPNVSYKQDASPVTEADERAEAIILAGLKAAFPDIPVVAEEAAAAGNIPDVSGRKFFLVDPLDGTKEFVNKRDDFTVNIALIEDGVPVAGIVYAPARKVAYTGIGNSAEKLVIAEDFSITSREAIGCRKAAAELTAVASRSHNSPETETFLAERGITSTKSVGSSLKFCLVAEGSADVYPRFGRTMEWDTAAGDAVLRAAGGVTLDMDDRAFRYGKTAQATDSDFANGHFVAWGAKR